MVKHPANRLLSQRANAACQCAPIRNTRSILVGRPDRRVHTPARLSKYFRLAEGCGALTCSRRLMGFIGVPSGQANRAAAITADNRQFQIASLLPLRRQGAGTSVALPPLRSD